MTDQRIIEIITSCGLAAGSIEGDRAQDIVRLALAGEHEELKQALSAAMLLLGDDADLKERWFARIQNQDKLLARVADLAWYAGYRACKCDGRTDDNARREPGVQNELNRIVAMIRSE